MSIRKRVLSTFLGAVVAAACVAAVGIAHENEEAEEEGDSTAVHGVHGENGPVECDGRALLLEDAGADGSFAYVEGYRELGEMMPGLESTGDIDLPSSPVGSPIHEIPVYLPACGADEGTVRREVVPGAAAYGSDDPKVLEAAAARYEDDPTRGLAEAAAESK